MKAQSSRLAKSINGDGDTSSGDDRCVLNKNVSIVLERRYLRKNRYGEIDETPEEMFRRVARTIARPELRYGSDSDAQYWEETFYRVMSKLEFLPNSPTVMNAGISTGTLSGCFVLGLEDTLDGIMTTAKDMALVQKFGGGTGFSLSAIRSKGTPIKTTHGKACGPVAVLRHLSSVSQLVTQGGKRDRANMAVMDVHHPDIQEFVRCKSIEGEIDNFNISVGATHEFMEAVKAETDYPLRAKADPSCRACEMPKAVNNRQPPKNAPIISIEVQPLSPP